jgi:hypothetical protein
MKRVLQTLAVALITVTAYAQFDVPGLDIPAFHAHAPKTAQKPLLTDAQLTGPYFTHDYQVTVYKMAQKIPNVLYQMPCYCRCDRELGHTSLRSCFEGTHGATCSVCMREGAYAYQQTKLGRTPAQIRLGIERGEYIEVDLASLKMD